MTQMKPVLLLLAICGVLAPLRGGAAPVSGAVQEPLPPAEIDTRTLPRAMQGMQLEPQRDVLDRKESRLTAEARAIVDPGERSLALQRAAFELVTSERLLRYQRDDAQAAIIERYTSLSFLRVLQVFVGDLDARRYQAEAMQRALNDLQRRRFEESVARYKDALSALRGATAAAEELPEGTLRDVRLNGASSTAMLLVEESMREVAPGSAYRRGSEPVSTRPIDQRARLYEIARAGVAVAVQTAERMRQQNFRSEVLSRVALSEIATSGQIARLLQRARDARAVEEEHFLGDQPMLLARGAQAAAESIKIPIWRDRTMVGLASSAANSGQFDSALRIARAIPEPQARGEALVRVAEAQALQGRPNDATQTYQEAGLAVISIEYASPRQTLAALLFDSLITVGRFEDARIAAGLVRDRQFRLRALGAVARSMGSRGLDQEAFAWIDTEVPPRDRDVLRRSVLDGKNLYIQNARMPRTARPTTEGGELLTPAELDRLFNPPRDPTP